MRRGRLGGRRPTGGGPLRGVVPGPALTLPVTAKTREAGGISHVMATLFRVDIKGWGEVLGRATSERGAAGSPRQTETCSPTQAGRMWGSSGFKKLSH